MPRYFFEFENASSSVPDLVGQDLPDGLAAKAEAARLAAELAANEAVVGRAPAYQWIAVVDEHGRPVVRLPVANAVREPNRVR